MQKEIEVHDAKTFHGVGNIQHNHVSKIEGIFNVLNNQLRDQIVTFVCTLFYNNKNI